MRRDAVVSAPDVTRYHLDPWTMVRAWRTNGDAWIRRQIGVLTIGQLQREQGVTGLFDVVELHDSLSSADELEAYEDALQRLAER